MQVIVLKNENGEPTHPSDGLEIWASGTATEELAGSLLTALAPELDIATWHSFDVFAKGLASSTAKEDQAIWTNIPVRLSGVHGIIETSIEIKQLTAASLMLNAIVDHIKKAASARHAWVWVE